MKKTILSAIAGIMLAVFLSVSTAFAVRYWYSINNDSNAFTVTMGKAVYLSVENEAGTATGVYQGSTIQFNTVTVVAPKWDTPSANVINPTMPTFNLRLNVLTEGGAIANPVPNMTVIAKMGEVTKFSGALANGVVLLEDLQTLDTTGEGFELSITLIVSDTLDVAFAGEQYKFQVEIVADGVNPGDTYINGTVPNA